VDIDDQRQLADAARHGDHSAWERLYRNVYPRLYSYAAARLGTSSAEDVVNETMARAVAGIEKFKWNGGGFDAWLFGILRRVCLEQYRKNNYSLGSGASQWIDHTDPGEAMERQAEHDELRRAFANLDDSERDILALRLVCGLSADEVARAVGKSPGAVRTAQSRALASLRQLIGDQQR
jgi:RNA polymerase sigma-70 factor (ECF subfamily)